MKQGWEIKKLGEIAIKLFAGGDKPKVFSEYPTDTLKIPVYANGVNLDGLVGYTDKAIVDKESITISARGTIGFCCIRQTPFVPIVRLITIIPTEEIRTRYLYYALSNATIENNGVAIPQLTIPMIKGIPIPIPPREEQERIVEELDCLSGVIEKKKQQLRELDALAQSIFYQMFGDPITNEKGWDVKKLKDIFSVKIGPFGSLLHNSDYISGGTPLVNPIHMHNEKICPDFDFTVSDDKLKELGNYILHIGDIVLARRGDIGRCAIVGMNEDGYLCGTGSLFIRPTTNINSIFTIKQIRCNSMIEHLTSLAKGATMLNINCKIVEELNVILPPLALQQEFADKIEAIEKQKELIKKSISETETLFNARMEYYFN